LASGKDVRFSAETADAFDPTDETCIRLSFDAVEFTRGGAVLKKAGEFFVDGLFHGVKILTLARGRDDYELTADLALVQVCGDVSRNLIVVDEAFIKARSFPRGENA